MNSVYSAIHKQTIIRSNVTQTEGLYDFLCVVLGSDNDFICLHCMLFGRYIYSLKWIKHIDCNDWTFEISWLNYNLTKCDGLSFTSSAFVSTSFRLHLSSARFDSNYILSFLCLYYSRCKKRTTSTKKGPYTKWIPGFVLVINVCNAIALSSTKANKFWFDFINW